ncbi:MAG: hypothetical protein QE273_05415 [Verrucomicrobiales bacterium]|nr:hypothetical protein [Verrucomicrobiales bacterium]
MIHLPFVRPELPDLLCFRVPAGRLEVFAKALFVSREGDLSQQYLPMMTTDHLGLKLALSGGHSFLRSRDLRFLRGSANFSP